jgi:hypothetical protein|tara:strand:- start:438 stop:587 length:150 start_codon:yes stop_codon:yes gene_type:complete
MKPKDNKWTKKQLMLLVKLGRMNKKDVPFIMKYERDIAKLKTKIRRKKK